MGLRVAAVGRGRAAMGLLLLAVVSRIATMRAQNIDTKQPYIRSSPDTAKVDHFGYSIALHQMTANTPGTTV